MIDRYDNSITFLDLLFNLVLLFVSLFILCFVLINTSKKEATVINKAEFLITMEWDKKSEHDIDLWLDDGIGHTCFFQRKEDGLMMLERDDLGQRNDWIDTANGRIKYEENREIITIRKSIETEYTVNIHAYRKEDNKPLNVRVEITKINPFQIVLVKNLTLENQGDEKTVCRMKVDKNGNVVGISDLPKKLVGNSQNGSEEQEGYGSGDVE